MSTVAPARTASRARAGARVLLVEDEPGARQLLAEIWGPGYEPRTNYLRFHMARLRRKLEDDPARPRHLLTEPGVGYRYRP
jgi:two-component system KDP operon response regulator KdpE